MIGVALVSAVAVGLVIGIAVLAFLSPGQPEPLRDSEGRSVPGRFFKAGHHRDWRCAAINDHPEP